MGAAVQMDRMDEGPKCLLVVACLPNVAGKKSGERGRGGIACCQPALTTLMGKGRNGPLCRPRSCPNPYKTLNLLEIHSNVPYSITTN